ncbi:MAG: ATP phosphoribosyltransferase [Bacteroidota bacterium]|nr:ATP phosphoribosyltransferase [Candidatus Kapabacteria bacterium]MDW8220810.1 ATP phosphoribosyltransferase [Bacteroidota bacterium]
MLRVAIQKSGRLTEESLELMHECGIDFAKSGGKLKALAYNFPVEFLFLRDDDIPEYVADGVADVGIVGENVIAEEHSALQQPVEIIERLGFSRCRLSLAVPRGTPYSSVHDLQGKRIATSFPNILRRFLATHNICAEIHEISGSVEIAPSIGLAEAICDIVSSGSTLLSNGLQEVETVFHSEAVLIARPLSADKQKIVDDLRFRIQSVGRAKHNKYIILNAPSESLPAIIQLLPGIKSPTITPLATSGWNAVHSVVPEDTFWEIIGKLKEAGAKGILVVPIEKMIL